MTEIHLVAIRSLMTRSRKAVPDRTIPDWRNHNIVKTYICSVLAMLFLCGCAIHKDKAPGRVSLGDDGDKAVSPDGIHALVISIDAERMRNDEPHAKALFLEDLSTKTRKEICCLRRSRSERVAV